jgi:hypothetical protein
VNALTITTTRAVWLNQYHTPDELMKYLERGEGGRASDILTTYGPPEMEKFGEGYTRIGEADITYRLLPRDEQAALAVASLNRKLEELRAAYLQKQQEIMEQISKLQAITYEAEA